MRGRIKKQLTQEEKDYIKANMKGSTVKQISDALGISTYYVKECKRDLENQSTESREVQIDDGKGNFNVDATEDWLL